MFCFRGKSSPPAPEEGVITVALGMPMSGDERNRIRAELGPAYRVVDICEAPLDTAVIVVGPCSAGALRMLTATFPDADVVVVEREDSRAIGPVTNALRAGARAYIVAVTEPDSLPASSAA
jgi:hypothetical protein